MKYFKFGNVFYVRIYVVMRYRIYENNVLTGWQFSIFLRYDNNVMTI